VFECFISITDDCPRFFAWPNMPVGLLLVVTYELVRRIGPVIEIEVGIDAKNHERSVPSHGRVGAAGLFRSAAAANTRKGHCRRTAAKGTKRERRRSFFILSLLTPLPSLLSTAANGCGNAVLQAK